VGGSRGGQLLAGANQGFVGESEPGLPGAVSKTYDMLCLLGKIGIFIAVVRGSFLFFTGG
jgi:hypothetical protein